MKREQFNRSHTAHGEDGRDVELHEYQDVIVTDTLDGRDETLGLKRLATAEGLPVNVIEKGVYEIVPTGEELTSDAPDAPGPEG